MPLIWREVLALVESLAQRPSLADRIRGEDRRHEALARLASSGEYRVVPTLMAFLVAEPSLAADTARTIAWLVRAVRPAQLAWIDDGARHGWFGHGWDEAYQRLSPHAIRDLARKSALDPLVIGLFASHGNGYVRAAALEELARATDGREIPFLALRANDWVTPVAARAADLLASRLTPVNRAATLDALPFIVRVFGQRRRDHMALSTALRQVLVSDAGIEALERVGAFDRSVRRFLYDLLATEGSGVESRAISVALTDRDAIIRLRAMARMTVANEIDTNVMLDRLLHHDSAPIVRSQALTMMAERTPSRVRDLVPELLFERAASVRRIARFLVTALGVPVVPSDVYREGLSDASAHRLSASIEGLGETGGRDDVDNLAPFLQAPVPRVRRLALRACVRLDVDRGVSFAVAALTDAASSVQTEAFVTLAKHARRVDFEAVSRRLDTLTDSRSRRNGLRLLRHAPKWDAVAFFLKAATDTDADLRAIAARLLNAWLVDFNRNQTKPSPQQLQRVRSLLDAAAGALSPESARLLRFSLS